MVELTRAAQSEIKEMLAAEGNPNVFLRLGVDEGGCTGFSYVMGFDEEKHDDDEVFDISGIQIITDEASKRYLRGLQIDFRKTAMGGGFALHNPNASVTCGCGSSFRTALDEGKPDSDC